MRLKELIKVLKMSNNIYIFFPFVVNYLTIIILNLNIDRPFCILLPIAWYKLNRTKPSAFLYIGDKSIFILYRYDSCLWYRGKVINCIELGILNSDNLILRFYITFMRVSEKVVKFVLCQCREVSVLNVPEIVDSYSSMDCSFVRGWAIEIAIWVYYYDIAY
jgi:hypothetical protein